MDILFKTGTLIDGTGSDPLPNGCFLVRDGAVATVGPAEQFAGAGGAEVIDLTGFFVMPGLVNAHTHLSIVPGDGDQLGQMRQPPAPKVLRSVANIARDLASGVTTARIMGEEHLIDIDIKAAIERGTVPGPRLIVSGVPLAASNGHGVALTASDGVDEVRRRARDNLRRGADFLKIFASGGLSTARPAPDACTYSRPEIAAAVEEAARAGTYVAAHAHGGAGVDLCVEEGVRTIEHGALVTDAQVEAIMRRDAWICGTFSILFHPDGIERTDFGVPAIRDKVLRARDTVRETFARVVPSGVNLAVGTDSMHGLMSFEIECLVEFGASPMQAILAATRDAARLCQVEDRVGTIAEGKAADFIALAGDPLADVKHLRTVAHVYRGGRRVAGGHA